MKEDDEDAPRQRTGIVAEQPLGSPGPPSVSRLPGSDDGGGGSGSGTERDATAALASLRRNDERRSWAVGIPSSRRFHQHGKLSLELG